MVARKAILIIKGRFKMEQFKKVFATPDGKMFDTQKEAVDYLRRPKIKAALLKVTEKNAELTDWLIEHQEAVEVAFETGTIRRVTKSERNKLTKALEALKEVKDAKGIAFLQENTVAILESFRWPTVKRMDDEEKKLVARNTLIKASEGNEQLAEWVLTNKDAILEAYAAGVEKREVNPKAAEALAAYRAKKAEEKAAKEAAAGKKE